MESNSLTKLGSSLPVPLVQELAKEINTSSENSIPQRYIRPDQDPPFTPHNSNFSPQVIPVLDMTNLLSSQKPVAESELEKLHIASKHWGFFQVHIISFLKNFKKNIQIYEKKTKSVVPFVTLLIYFLSYIFNYYKSWRVLISSVYM